MSKSLAWIGTRAATSLLLASRCSRSSFSNSGLGSLRRPASPLVLKCSMSDVPKTAMDFRVATYNILCSHLAEPARFPMCDPKNLDAPTRLTKIKQKLDTEVSAGRVAALIFSRLCRSRTAAATAVCCHTATICRLRRLCTQSACLATSGHVVSYWGCCRYSSI